MKLWSQMTKQNCITQSYLLSRKYVFILLIVLMVHWNTFRWVKSFSRVWLFTTPWTVAHQPPPSMGFSRQEYWSGLPLPSPPVSLGDWRKKKKKLHMGGVEWIRGGRSFQRTRSWRTILRTFTFAIKIMRNFKRFYAWSSVTPLPLCIITPGPECHLYA